MKKVLFVTNTMGRAGAETTLVALLDGFDREKYDVSVLSIIPRGEIFGSLPPKVKILNKKYSCGSVMNKAAVFSNILLILKAMFRYLYFIPYLPYAVKNIIGQLRQGKFSFDKLFWKALAMYAPVPDERFDLAVAYLEGAATYYVADRVKADKKASFLHIDYTRSGYVKKLDKPYFDKIDRIFCVSESVQKGLIATFPEYKEKSDIFQNAISDRIILEKAEKGEGFTDDFDGIRLLTIGRLHYQKAYDIAIKAFARLLKEHKLNIRWYVLGEGMERKNLEKLIKQYGLEDRFILMGANPNPYPFLKQCDIYVHATRYEGWCIATAEAKILKKPIIASETAGIKEQLSPESSVIINLNEDEIINSITRLAENPELRKDLEQKLEAKWERPDDTVKLYSLMGE